MVATKAGGTHSTGMHSSKQVLKVLLCQLVCILHHFEGTFTPFSSKVLKVYRCDALVCKRPSMKGFERGFPIKDLNWHLCLKEGLVPLKKGEISCYSFVLLCEQVEFIQLLTPNALA